MSTPSSSLPSGYPHWLAIVQALKTEHLGSKSQISLHEAACPWGNFLLLSQFPLQENGDSQYLLSHTVVLWIK